MKIFRFFLILSFLYITTSCEELLNLADDGLTNEDVVSGLRTALKVGTDTSVTLTSQIDGYYKDEVIKIMLPPEADIIVDNLDDPLLQAIGIDQLIEDVILRINRSAEHAAPQAKDIFVDAIVNLSIDDGFKILNGQNPNDLKSGMNEEFDSLAATHYLQDETYTQLESAFSPVIGNALHQDLVGGISTMEAWDELTNTYNKVALSFAGQVAGLKPVETELDVFVTQKALDGLFLKVGEEEKKIRRDPYQWALDILHRVFG